MKKLMIFLCLFSSSSFALDYGYFTSSIKNICPKTNQLLVKKTFLSFVRANKSSCDSGFAKKLLDSCSSLSCDELIVTYNDSATGVSGTVIGGAN